MKKYISYIFILIILTILSSPLSVLRAEEPKGTCYSNGSTLAGYTRKACTDNSPNALWEPPDAVRGVCTLANGTKNPNWTEAACRVNSPGAVWAGPYQLLAPLPGGDNGNGIKSFDTAQADSLREYLNIIIKIITGMAAVLAVIMIVIGGIEYMTSELISSKEAGKERIEHALLGLLLALGAYAILNTLNPSLLSTQISMDQAVIMTSDEKNFAQTERTVASAGRGYRANASPSAGVADFVRDRLSKEPLTTITVDSASKKAYFYVGNDWNHPVVVDINTGYKGVAGVGQAQSGDGKTPRGETTITSAMIGSGGNGVLTRDGTYNLGAAFVNIGATAGGADRGIGFHGSPDNALATTNGCIRMRNEDLVALAPYMKPGVKVIIK